MAGRIFITGDKHGAILHLSDFAIRHALNEEDILIIAGDAGYVWNKDYPYMMETLSQVFPGIIAFIDGNHENHALLNSLKLSKWNGGNVHQLGERIYHLIRGEIYTIYEICFFVFGGARSIDKDRRKEGVSWWKEEEPTPKEISFGGKQIMEHADKINYVITHEAPLFARAHIKREKPIDDDYFLPMIFEEWYKIISSVPGFKKWYFGHMHTDKEINSQLYGVYNNFLLIENAI